MLRLILYMVGVDFLAVGAIVATLNWWVGHCFKLASQNSPFFLLSRLVTNRAMLRTAVHSTEQSVEWAYAFDVHCNSFFPMSLITYFIQFCFLSIINRDGWLSAFFADTMYLVAVSWYCYVTFLGYSGGLSVKGWPNSSQS
jgi:hypothetical protein